MKKSEELKYDGEFIEIVPCINLKCEDCVFWKYCNGLDNLPSEEWEKENGLESCTTTKKKYIPKNEFSA